MHAMIAATLVNLTLMAAPAAPTAKAPRPAAAQPKASAAPKAAVPKAATKAAAAVKKAAAPAKAAATKTAATAKKTPAKVVPAAKLHPVEARLVKQTNAQRARFGLRPLRLDFRLMRSARRHTAWMTKARSLQHTSAPVAENIAMGQQNVQAAMVSWMNSPGHRANILGNYDKVGVAAYRTPGGTIFWCQQFSH